MTTTRRDFLQRSAFGALTFSLMGSTLALSPREARARSIPLRVFNTEQAATLEALGEVLLPGSAAVGLMQFIDYHCAEPPEQSLLMLKYLDVTPPYGEFYKQGINALNRLSEAGYKKPFSAVDPVEQEALVEQLKGAQPKDWESAIPAFRFYMVVRADAVDVFYGTVEGFERLAIPYMPHILPQKPW